MYKELIEQISDSIQRIERSVIDLRVDIKSKQDELTSLEIYLFQCNSCIKLLEQYPKDKV